MSLEFSGNACLARLAAPAAAAGAALVGGDMDSYALLRYLGVEG